VEHADAQLRGQLWSMLEQLCFVRVQNLERNCSTSLAHTNVALLGRTYFSVHQQLDSAAETLKRLDKQPPICLSRRGQAAALQVLYTDGAAPALITSMLRKQSTTKQHCNMLAKWAKQLHLNMHVIIQLPDNSTPLAI
jgi:hypothetical protein